MSKTVNTYSGLLADAIGATNTANLAFNANVFVEQTKKRYEDLITEMDCNQYTNRYRWEGLPYQLPSWLIESMLYYRGSLVGFYNAGELKVLPYAQVGPVNIYGLPIKVRAVPYNGTAAEMNPSERGYELNITYTGDAGPDTGDRGILLYDRTPLVRNSAYISRFALNKEINNEMAEILARIKNNVRNSDDKIVFYAANEDQKDLFMKQISNSYNADLPFIVIVGDATTSGFKTDQFHPEVQLKTQALFEAYQSLNNIRSMCEGLPSGGAFQKKERMITEEADDETSQAHVIMDAGLYMRNLWLAQMMIAFPEHLEELKKIKIYANYDSMEEDYPNQEGDDRDGDEDDTDKEGTQDEPKTK